MTEIVEGRIRADRGHVRRMARPDRRTIRATSGADELDRATARRRARARARLRQRRRRPRCSRGASTSPASTSRRSRSGARGRTSRRHAFLVADFTELELPAGAFDARRVVLRLQPRPARAARAAARAHTGMARPRRPPARRLRHRRHRGVDRRVARRDDVLLELSHRGQLAARARGGVRDAARRGRRVRRAGRTGRGSNGCLRVRSDPLPRAARGGEGRRLRVGELRPASARRRRLSCATTSTSRSRRRSRWRRLEHELGVRATYFLMTESGFYNLDSHVGHYAQRQLRNWGHAVGLHAVYPRAELDRRFDPVVAWHNPDPEYMSQPIGGAVNVMEEPFFTQGLYRSDSNHALARGLPARRARRRRVRVAAAARPSGDLGVRGRDDARDDASRCSTRSARSGARCSQADRIDLS